jgi:hypothetical protein
MSTFEQTKPDILRCYDLEGAKECESSSETEQWRNHPYYPNTFLIWADFKEGEYTFLTLKVKDSDQLVYTIGRMEVSKEDSKTFKSVDSKALGIFAETNGLEMNPDFRARMDLLIHWNKK